VAKNFFEVREPSVRGISQREMRYLVVVVAAAGSRARSARHNLFDVADVRTLESQPRR
jgi:hypothetical protein